MRNKILPFSLLFFLLVAHCVSAEEADTPELIPLKGISLQMKKKKLLNNWGFPAKRDHKTNSEVWFYPNENTASPTDGIVVYLVKGRVSGWKTSENLFAEMEVWGKGAGTYR
ncbi:MAG: hypothetical protein ABH875_06915 [Candidatus Omnitrophota bacterium]